MCMGRVGVAMRKEERAVLPPGGGGTRTPVAVSNTVLALPNLTRFDVRQWHKFYQHRVLRRQVSNLDAI